MKKHCTNCKSFTASTIYPNDWEYGRCKLTGHYAENDASAWGNCGEKRKKWVGNTPELSEEARLADMPIWKRIFMD